MRASRVIPLLVLALSCAKPSQVDTSLGQLDGYVSSRELYTVRKTAQLETLSTLARRHQDPLRRYEAESELANEYFAFNFDSTQAYLKRCQELALEIGDTDRYNKASIQLGHLYAKAGSYMEAYTLLYDQMDTASLSAPLKEEYFYTLYDFSRDLSGNSGMVERLQIPDREVFRHRLYSMVPKNTDRWRLLRMHECTEKGQYASADSLCRLLLSGAGPEQHNYAIYAYEMSDIHYSTGDDAGRLEWLIKSAESDIINSVKDYASLTMVAQIILPTDVERSFHYLRIAQEDAIFYNAKLRPWQISRFLLDVEDAYSREQMKSSRSLRLAMIMLAVLALMLSFMEWFLVVRSRKLARARKELESLNNRISGQDRVKEELIVDFLEGLSGQISAVRQEDNRFRGLLKRGQSDQLLKELSISGRSEKARAEFYQTFDRTFLAIYPNFVEEFNALIKEEARIHPPKGRLTTELRIFALILLGVDDSKDIAAMLDYSLSTIYNHKVTIKNASLGDRSSFEKRVKMIGK